MKRIKSGRFFYTELRVIVKISDGNRMHLKCDAGEKYFDVVERTP